MVDEPENKDPREALRWYWRKCKALWSGLIRADSTFHAWLYSRFPLPVKIGGTILRAAYTFFVSPAFAVVLALLLVPFVISGVVPVIVTLSVFGAWMVATLSVAKLQSVNQLRIGRRLILVIGVAALMAIAGNKYVKWVLVNFYKTQRAAVQVSDIDKLAYDRFKELFDTEVERYISSQTTRANPTGVQVVNPPKEQKADLALEFAGKQDLLLMLSNTTTIPARDPKHWFGIIDATNMYVFPDKPGVYQPLPLQTQTFANDYVRGGERTGPYSVLSESPSESAKKHAKDGDILFGMISATCINCIRVRKYYIYFRIGSGGWFYPIPASKKFVNILMPKTQSIPEEQITAFLDSEVPPKLRIPIPESFNYETPTKRLP